MPYPFLIELVVVFKKEVSTERAAAILTALNYPHREGSDSSRGKAYFYSTGPKFIAHVPRDRTDDFRAALAAYPELHEVYEPDWRVEKD